MSSFEPTLFIHNLGFASGTIVAIVLAIYVYLKDPRARTNITFALAFFSIAVFCGSHVWGVNVSDPYLSRNILMWNISVIYIACFLAHCSFELAGIAEKQRTFLYANYIVAVILTIIYAVYPDTYLLPSQPKMYFPNYYVAGSLQWIMRIIFDIISPVYFLIMLAIVYRKAELALKNRLKYFFVSIFSGYLIGSLAIPLVYDVPIDPVYAAFFVPLLAIPMAYAIVKYSLMDIKVVAKRAVVYAILVTGATLLLVAVSSLNQFFISRNPLFPTFLIPCLASIVSIGIGYLVWNRLQQIDLLKTEFLTIVTHRFRTPLTRIRWALDRLSSANVGSDSKNALQTISLANDNLVELTSELIRLSEKENEAEAYRLDLTNLNALLASLVARYQTLFNAKKIRFDLKPVEGSDVALLDEKKFSFVLQTVIDNALDYTLEGGTVEIIISDAVKKLNITVKDTGIGIDSRDKSLIFEKFYRSLEAQKADTEGLGIGLYIAKQILERMQCQIWIDSEGNGKGTAVLISVPRAKPHRDSLM